MPFTLRDMVRAPKENISIGNWKTGKVPRADFPIAKNAYGLGASYRWCVISFDALNVQCKCLVIMNIAKQKYEAILGVAGTGALRILCSYEYHASEPGWHCHAACDPISRVPSGFMRGPWVRRVPPGNKPHRRQSLRIGNEKDAQRFAFECYGIHATGSLL